MRVLMLAQAYAPIPGGEERAVENLADALVHRGHHVAVAALAQPVPQRHPSGAVRVHELGSATHRLPGAQRDPGRRYAPPFPDPETVRDLSRVIEAERPDVVHSHNLLVHAFLPLKPRSGAALVHSLHDYSTKCAIKRLFTAGEPCSGPGPVKCLRCAGDYYGPARGAAMVVGTAATLPWLRREVDMFVPVSRAVWERSRPRGAERYEVIPNFLTRLPEPVVDDDRLGELPERYVAYVGDIRADKGAVALAHAHASIPGAPPLVMLGRRHAHLPERANVRVLGPWPHRLAIEVLRRALFSVVPSILAEPFGLAALEAMALGRPVIASRIGGLPDVVADEETGVLVPPGDVAALAAAMRRLLGDEEQRARLGARARERAHREFSASLVVPRLERVYRAAVEQART